MDAKRKLKGMLARIFSDAEATDDERAELRAYVDSGALAPSEVREVIHDFVETTWKITLADGVVSETERKRLQEIVRVLELAEADLPAGWREALAASAQSGK